MKTKLFLLLAILFISCSKDDDSNVDPYGEDCGPQGCKNYTFLIYDVDTKDYEETSINLKCGLDKPGTETAKFIEEGHSLDVVMEFSYEHRCHPEYTDPNFE